MIFELAVLAGPSLELLFIRAQSFPWNLLTESRQTEWAGRDKASLLVSKSHTPEVDMSWNGIQNSTSLYTVYKGSLGYELVLDWCSFVMHVKSLV